MIPKNSEDVVWNKYNRCHHAQLEERGKRAAVNQHEQKLEACRMRCLDTDEDNVVSLQVIKLKIVDGLIPLFRNKV